MRERGVGIGAFLGKEAVLVTSCRVGEDNDFFSILLVGGNESCQSTNTSVKAAQISLKSNKA
jgi:hypothetical protein